MDVDKFTIREVMEKTRGMPIVEGGLSFMFEKIVKEIEFLQDNVEQLVEKRIEDLGR